MSEMWSVAVALWAVLRLLPGWLWHNRAVIWYDLWHDERRS